jgi:DNA-binding transcriptional MerR regulator
MTIHKAAELMGCTPRHLRHLCSTGRVKSRVTVRGAQARYTVSEASCLEYQRTKSPVGFPAGAKRDGVRGMKIATQEPEETGP